MSTIGKMRTARSRSHFKDKHIIMRLGPRIDISTIGFRVLSLVHRICGRLPRNIDFPGLSNNGIINDRQRRRAVHLLGCRVGTTVDKGRLHRCVQRFMRGRLHGSRSVGHISIANTRDECVRVSCSPSIVSICNVATGSVRRTVQDFVKHRSVIKRILERGINSKSNTGRHVSLCLITSGFTHRLRRVPVGRISNGVICLGGLIAFRCGRQLPGDCFHIGKLGAVGLGVFISTSTSGVLLSHGLQSGISRTSKELGRNICLALISSTTRGTRDRLNGLVNHALLTLTVLLTFI